MQFRRYATFADRDNFTAHWGIQLFDSSYNAIVNYPKYHIDRGQAKNHALRTAGQYKATVRLLKNLRNYLVDNNLLADGIAPSYFLECALYNVPDAAFVGSFDDTLPKILDYLWTTPYAGFYCQNGVVPLICSSPTQWHKDDFATFIQAARNAWEGW